jgi:glycosyltransferase involved in cell wall biosynthesis
MEGFGLVVADAVAAGLPVVGMRVGSIPEVVREGIDGCLVEYGDANAFANAVVKILAGSNSADLGSSDKRSERFSWNVTVRDTLDLYEKTLAFHRPQRALEG